MKSASYKLQIILIFSLLISCTSIKNFTAKYSPFTTRKEVVLKGQEIKEGQGTSDKRQGNTVDSSRITVNPQLSTANTQPATASKPKTDSTVNSQPSTVNSQPATAGKPITHNQKLKTDSSGYRQQSTVNLQPTTRHGGQAQNPKLS